MAPLHFVHKTGQGFGDVFDDLARLRIAVFQDFPYLYEGTVDYEKTYLQTYANAERAENDGVLAAIAECCWSDDDWVHCIIG